jgi:hypothetical protein
MKTNFFLCLVFFTFLTLSPYTKNMNLPHTGSWGTPDFGITELISRLLNQGRTVDGGSNLREDTGKPTAISPTGARIEGPGLGWNNDAIMNYPGGQRVFPMPQMSGTTMKIPSGEGADTSNLPNNGGGGGGGNVTPAGSNDPGMDLATMKWLADLERAKSDARSLRGEGERNFGVIMDAVKRFRDRASGLRDEGAQQISNTFNEIAGGNARLGQDARKQALLTARAGGYGDSSKMGLLNSVTGSLAGQQGSAMARRGENDSSNQALYQSRQDEAQTQEDTASNYLQGINQKAGEIERLGSQDAGFNLGNSLNSILQNAQMMRSIQAPNANSLSSFNPNFSGIANTLNSLIGGMSANMNTSGANEGSVNIRPNNTLDELLRRSGLVR